MIFDWIVEIGSPDGDTTRVVTGIVAHNWRHALLDATMQCDVAPPEVLSSEHCDAITITCPNTGLTYRITRAPSGTAERKSRDGKIIATAL